MKLLFKQRMFSWLDSYDIYDEGKNTLFTVKGRLDWGHRLEIYDHRDEYVGMIKEKVFSFLPRFEMHIGDKYIGNIKQELTFLRPVFTLDCNGWTVTGDPWAWNYQVIDPHAMPIMQATKELFNWTDTYSIHILNPADALLSLMIVLAIDAAKCSGGKG